MSASIGQTLFDFRQAKAMPKLRRDQKAEEFGQRLVALLEAAGRPRHGAGAYLAKRYRVSTVTANDWLNGRFRPEPGLAGRIAEDHGGTFDSLYFGKPLGIAEPAGAYLASQNPLYQPVREQRDTMRAAARIMERAREFIIGTVDEDALIDNAIDAALEVGPAAILDGEDGLMEGVRLVAAKFKSA